MSTRASTSTTSSDTSGIFRSLHFYNYRLFFSGQLISNSGTWMQNVALGWLVLRITNSSFDVGLVTALQFLPTLLLGTYAGVLADRFPKRRTLLMTQSGMALAAATLATITITHHDNLFAIYAVTAVSGIFGAFDNPTRQSFVSEMVGPDHLTNAISLNSAMFNMSRVLGPAIGAIVIKAFDVGPCFAINAISFLAVIAGLAIMRPAEFYAAKPVRRAKGQIREGLRYVWRTPELRQTLSLLALVGTLSFNFQTVLPVLARNTFHGDAGTYGVLTSLMGLGSMAGALFVASRVRVRRIFLVANCTVFGVLLAAAAMAPNLDVESVLLTLVGVSSIGYMATSNSMCQMTSAPEMRGRVMALYMMVFLGSTPVGGLIVGWIDGRLGPRYGLGLGAAAALGGGIISAAMMLKGSRQGSHSHVVVAA